MKNPTLNTALAAGLLLATLNPQLSALAQGSLTPPGAPAPTMKSLAQIEPRTPIATLPFTISSPGSYYLTTNLNGFPSYSGITISANNVAVDLNGFALQGGALTVDGIHVGGALTNISVRNGAISGWGGDGVYMGGYGSASQNLALENLLISGNGGSGIEAANCVVQNCQSSDKAFHGISVAPGTVSRCLVQNNGWSGIYVNAPGSEVICNRCVGNNNGTAISNAGIFINDSYNRIEDNHISGGTNGIMVTSGYVKNVIIKNTVIGVGLFPIYSPTPQITGPTIYNTDAFGTITNSNPWANFLF